MCSIHKLDLRHNIVFIRPWLVSELIKACKFAITGPTILWRPSLSGVGIHCRICVFVLSLLLGKVRPSVLF